LIGGALAVSLVFGAAEVVIDRLRPIATFDHPANPVSDEQSRKQVVEPAKQIVALGGLQTTSAGYLLVSCKNQYDPPYQGVVYLTFAVPSGANAASYFPTIAATLTASGWTQGAPAPNHPFGSTLSKDAVAVSIYPQDDDSGFGVLNLSGECRNGNDHRSDSTGWADITAELSGHSGP
jgi:hypothetical protein